MTNNRIKEAEEAGKCYRDTPIFIAGYLAACEKLEGERDAYALDVLQWIFDNDISQLFPDQMLALYKQRKDDDSEPIQNPQP